MLFSPKGPKNITCRWRSRGTGPRATEKKRFLSHRGETRSDARMASEGPALRKKMPPPHRRARACPSPCVWLAERITPVSQDRLKLWHICQAILTRSGAGAPELQRWARCLPVGGTSLSRYALWVGGTSLSRYEKSRPGGLSYGDSDCRKIKGDLKW